MKFSELKTGQFFVRMRENTLEVVPHVAMKTGENTFSYFASRILPQRVHGKTTSDFFVKKVTTFGRLKVGEQFCRVDNGCLALDMEKVSDTEAKNVCGEVQFVSPHTDVYND